MDSILIRVSCNFPLLSHTSFRLVTVELLLTRNRISPHYASPFPTVYLGWFKPGGTCRSRRLYNYTLHPSGRYVLWDVKETRHGIEQCESALIYTHQVFFSINLQRQPTRIDKTCCIYVLLRPSEWLGLVKKKLVPVC